MSSGRSPILCPKLLTWAGRVILTVAAILHLSTVRAETSATYVLHLQKHVFSPENLIVPAHRPIILHVSNDDNHPEEFESYDLEFEIIVLPHHAIDVPIRALPPGTYEFFGDFHPRTARGHLTVHP
ncbi:cupredoxin domain-containing protein [Leptospirillum ferriphilum]|uniref:EfeO-type cupredoxin-like domain-containing protein n=2 Tax=Leptospirillum TaxID=179 RepID=A0A094X3N5_9BACT|nr:cupredoxin domain-containing protein [Leptospirillum ferriphilum]EAY57255.1 MAG: conserved protein of unknown function [Leptospirillum rubarum]EDZ38732.1 MAG: Conserved hypothetical protein [Leptospirillum sp. Group II '5-way CG']KGA93194.1 hypothetical protein LptCag_1889 [Leptospirillum ferriphilum]